MTGNVDQGARILGRLGSGDGKGVVRLEDRFDTDINDMWSALTEAPRLGRWYGEVEGDLRVGGEYRARLFASGWEGTGRVEACEPPHQFVVTSKEEDGPGEVRTEDAHPGRRPDDRRIRGARHAAGEPGRWPTEPGTRLTSKIWPITSPVTSAEPT